MWLKSGVEAVLETSFSGTSPAELDDFSSSSSNRLSNSPSSSDKQILRKLA